MTKTDFIILCEKYGVAPEVALENANLRKALTCRDAVEVERILREEF